MVQATRAEAEASGRSDYPESAPATSAEFNESAGCCNMFEPAEAA